MQLRDYNRITYSTNLHQGRDLQLKNGYCGDNVFRKKESNGKQARESEGDLYCYIPEVFENNFTRYSKVRLLANSGKYNLESPFRHSMQYLQVF